MKIEDIKKEFPPMPQEIRDMIENEVKAQVGAAPQRKRRRPLRTGAFIALAAALLMGTTALAVYEARLSDRELITVDNGDGTETTFFSIAGGAAGLSETETETETDDSASEETSSQVLANKEFLAAQEWLEYFFNRSEADHDELIPAEERTVYGYAYKAIGEKLAAIAEKYGLRLMQSVTHISSLEEFCGAIGVDSFMAAADDSCIVQLFDEGSFEANAMYMENPLAEADLAIQIYRIAKGTMTDFALLGDSAESYEYEVYATACGVTVELALSSRYSFIFAALDNCYIACEFGGLQGNGYQLQTDMNGLKQIADAIDFSVLDIQA